MLVQELLLRLLFFTQRLPKRIAAIPTVMELMATTAGEHGCLMEIHTLPHLEQPVVEAGLSQWIYPKEFTQNHGQFQLVWHVQRVANPESIIC